MHSDKWGGVGEHKGPVGQKFKLEQHTDQLGWVDLIVAESFHLLINNDSRYIKSTS